VTEPRSWFVGPGINGQKVREDAERQAREGGTVIVHAHVKTGHCTFKCYQYEGSTCIPYQEETEQ
jgi:hypothetical protein